MKIECIINFNVFREEGEFLNGKKVNEWIIMNKITNVIER